MEMPLWFIFGVFVYIRQAALSLHRSDIENSPNEIDEYHQQNKIPCPDTLIGYFNNDTFFFRDNVFSNDTISKIEAIYQNKKIKFSKNEMVEIIKSLEEYSIFFKNTEDNQFNIEEKNRIRLLLTNCCDFLEKKLPQPLVERGRSVTHINQNNHLELCSFQDLVGLNWPNGTK